MSKFFESEVVQGRVAAYARTLPDINKMGLLLTAPQKKIQLDKMMELINLQQTMFMRLSLCNDESQSIHASDQRGSTDVGYEPC